MLDALGPLAESKSVTCSGGGVFLEGGAFLSNPAPVNVSRIGADNTEALYDPDYDGSDFATAAYAFYHWNLRGFNGNQTFGFTWNEEDEQTILLDYWIGLGNLSTDAWDWYKGPKDTVLTIDSFGPYRSATGQVLMVVMLIGSDQATLSFMEAGVPELRATGDIDMPGNAPGYPLLGLSGSLPASFDLSDECSPVNDQLTWGSCTAFAVGDGAYNYELGQVYGALGWELSNSRYRVSPKHLYIVSGELQGIPPGGGSGRWTYQVVDDLEEHGVATEFNAPYDLVYDNNWSPAALADAGVLMIEKWQEVPCNTWEGISTVKQMIAQQRKVLPMRAYLDSSFFGYEAGQVWYPQGSISGGHAMCIVGYDDTQGVSGAFKVRNSWSDYWGNDGHVWIGYEAFLDTATSVRAWTISEEYSSSVIDHFGLEPPGTPPVTNLVASDGTSTSGIELSWEPRAGTSVYTVYRDEMTNSVAEVSSPNWVDTTITDSYGHIYWVRADTSALSAPDVGFLAAIPQIEAVNPTVVTEGEEVTFSAAGMGSAPLNYMWDFGGSATPNSSTNARPQVIITTPGTYNAALYLENDLGSDLYNFEITVEAIPPVISYISGESGYSGDLTTLSAMVEGTPSSYAWDFGDGATPSVSNMAQPQVTLGSPGLYESSLTVTSEGMSDVFYFYLAVLDDTETTWLDPGHDKRNSSSSPVVGPQTSNVKWKLYLGNTTDEFQNNNYISNPLVLPDGDVIVANNANVDGCTLWRINSDGSVQWNKRSFEQYDDFGQPLLSQAGDMLFVTQGQATTALDPLDGSEIWSSLPVDSAEDHHYKPIMHAPNGLLYTLKSWKWLTALDPADGSEALGLFQLTTKYRYSYPWVSLLSPGGMLFMRGQMDADNLLIAFDTASQAPVGSLRVLNEAASLALSADGLSIYMTDAIGDTWAYNTDTCTQLWHQPGTRFDGIIDNQNAPCVLPNGDVVVANMAGLVCWLDPDTGEILSSYELDTPNNLCKSSPAAGRDGTVYLGGSQTRLYALKDGTLLWESDVANTLYFSGSPAIGPDGTLYAGDECGWLWAFDEGGTGEEFVPPVVSEVSPLQGDEGEEVTFSATMIGTAPVTYAWDFGGGATPNTSTDANPVVTLTTEGSYNCSVEVSNAFDTTTYSFTLDVVIPYTGPRWESYVIADYARTFLVDAEVVNNRPAVIVNETDYGQARFLYSNVEQPTSADDWEFEEIPGVEVAHTLADVGNEPVIVEFVDLKHLNYHRRSGGTWIGHEVVTVSTTSEYAEVGQVNDLPAIVYARDEPGAKQLVYAYSDVLHPESSTDWTLVNVTEPIDTPRDGMILADSSGIPNIGFIYKDSVRRVSFARATKINPTDISDWTWHVVDPDRGYHFDFAFMVYDGRPMFAYAETGYPTDLFVARATSSTPSSSEDYSFHVVENRSSMVARDLVDIGGFPAIGYESMYPTIATANVAEPSSSDDWTIDRLNITDTYFELINVAGHPVFLLKSGYNPYLIYYYFVPGS
jgi:PKD repeat protein/C1A family cysteine protease